MTALSNKTDNFVEIFILNTNALTGEDDGILPIIAPLYVRKYERAKVPNVKVQELGAGYLLSKYLGISKDEQLSISEYGKPSIKDQLSESPVEFSLSHSDKYVVLGVSNVPIGIDIENADRLSLSVLKRVLPPFYYERLKNRDYSESGDFEKDEKLAWAKSWTSIEAILKATGSGFSVDPRENPAFMDGWFIESFITDEKFVISCAAQSPFIIKNTTVITSIE